MSGAARVSRTPRPLALLLAAAVLAAAPTLAAGTVAAPTATAAPLVSAGPTVTTAVPVPAARRAGSPGALRPSWQVDGRVMAVKIVGDRVVVGGEFTHAIAPNGRKVPASNLAVFTLGTGRLVAGAVPGTDGVVRALAARGRWLWVGGYFERVGAEMRPGLAKIDLSTGRLETGFDARLDHGVQALALQGSGLLVGGRMTRVGDLARSSLARVDAASGQVDAAFRARIAGPVFALGTDKRTRRVWAGGAFERAAGRARDSIVALDWSTGRPRGRQLARSGGDVLSLQVASRGRRVLIADMFNVLCSWSATTGKRQWRIAAGGDVQAVRVRGNLAYFGVHGGFGGSARAKLLVAQVGTGKVQPWRPGIPDFWGIYAIDANRRGLVAGGRITRVAGVPARGWVRFVS